MYLEREDLIVSALVGELIVHDTKEHLVPTFVAPGHRPLGIRIRGILAGIIERAYDTNLCAGWHELGLFV